MATIEVTDALNERIKKYCKENNIDVKEFVQNQMEMTMSEVENPNPEKKKNFRFR